MTQSAQIIAAIRRSRRGLTYGELESLRISTCPWKRLEESGEKHLRKGETLERQWCPVTGLVRFVIVKVLA